MNFLSMIDNISVILSGNSSHYFKKPLAHGWQYEVVVCKNDYIVAENKILQLWLKVVRAEQTEPYIVLQE